MAGKRSEPCEPTAIFKSNAAQNATEAKAAFLTRGVAGEGAEGGAAEGAGEGWELSNTSLSSPPLHLAAPSPSGMFGLPLGSAALPASSVGTVRPLVNTDHTAV